MCEEIVLGRSVAEIMKVMKSGLALNLDQIWNEL